jgi:hypothetical protein
MAEIHKHKPKQKRYGNGVDAETGAWVHDQDPPQSCGCDAEDKHAAYLKAQKEYRDSLREEAYQQIKKRTLKEDIISGAKSVCWEGARAASGFIHAGAKVGDAFERDLNRNSQSSIANRAVLRAMFEKHKAAEKKQTNMRVEKVYKVVLNGKTTEMTDKQYKQFLAAARSSPAPRKRR